MSKSVQPALKFHERRRKQRELKEQQKRQGKQYPPAFTLPNRKSDLKTVDEEKEAIQQSREFLVKSIGNWYKNVNFRPRKIFLMRQLW